MRVRINFIYVTALLDGIDVMTRHYPARQHNVGAVSLHTPAMQACDRKLQLPASCSSGTVQSLYRRCTTSTPAVKGFIQYPTRDALQPPKTTQYI